MKKVLIGLAAGALAVTAMTSPASAMVYPTTNTVYEVLTDYSGVADLLIDSAGLDGALDDCGNNGSNAGLPNYTVFFPADDAIFEAVLESLDLTLGQILAQPALVKTVLLYHVVPSNIAPVQFDMDQTKSFTTMGGLKLIKTETVAGYAINGYSVLDAGAVSMGYYQDYAIQACNGWVYLLAGFLAPDSSIGTIGLTNDGSTTQSSPPAAGLPATGSSSMALTYAALASLIAGAGVLVIRRRSVA